jgi:hypothetical protein
MIAMARLRREHDLLRSKAQAVASLFAEGQESGPLVGQLCHALMVELRSHVRREDALAALAPEDAVSHQGALQALESLVKALVTRRLFAAPQARPLFEVFHRTLQHTMDQQEAQLFPALEERLRSGGPVEVPAPELAVDDRMSLNSFIHLYPWTKPAFEQILSLPAEGCDSLEEIAWRRGTDPQALIAQLGLSKSRKATASPSMRKPVARALQEVDPLR